jgi:hypothetical protein
LREGGDLKAILVVKEEGGCQFSVEVYRTSEVRKIVSKSLFFLLI